MNKKNKIVFLILGIFALIVLILFFPLKNIFTGNAISLKKVNPPILPPEPPEEPIGKK